MMWGQDEQRIPTIVQKDIASMNQRFCEVLEAMSYEIRIVSDGGNNLFIAIADAIKLPNVDHVCLRSLCSSYVRDHFQEFGFFGLPNFQDFQFEAQSMHDVGFWCGHLSLIAACQVFEIDITVFSMDGTCVRFPGHKRYEKKIELSFHYGSHYNVLKRKGSNSSDVYVGLEGSLLSSLAIGLAIDQDDLKKVVFRFLNENFDGLKIYAQTMPRFVRQDSAIGTDLLSIMAISRIYDVNVIVHLQSNRISFPCDGRFQKSIRLSFLDGLYCKYLSEADDKDMTTLGTSLQMTHIR